MQPTTTLIGQRARFLMLQQLVYMSTAVLFKVNLLDPIYFGICHATESRFVLLEFVKMSDAVHHHAGMCLSKCLIEFHRKLKKSTFWLVCCYYICIFVCAGNCGCV
jgi:hypothetical protein